MRLHHLIDAHRAGESWCRPLPLLSASGTMPTLPHTPLMPFRALAMTYRDVPVEARASVPTTAC